MKSKSCLFFISVAANPHARGARRARAHKPQAEVSTYSENFENCLRDSPSRANAAADEKLRGK
jgi:hypothetical protein